MLEQEEWKTYTFFFHHHHNRDCLLLVYQNRVIQPFCFSAWFLVIDRLCRKHLRLPLNDVNADWRTTRISINKIPPHGPLLFVFFASERSCSGSSAFIHIPKNATNWQTSLNKTHICTSLYRYIEFALSGHKKWLSRASGNCTIGGPPPSLESITSKG